MWRLTPTAAASRQVAFGLRQGIGRGYIGLAGVRHVGVGWPGMVSALGLQGYIPCRYPAVKHRFDESFPVGVWDVFVWTPGYTSIHMPAHMAVHMPITAISTDISRVLGGQNRIKIDTYKIFFYPC